MKRLCLYAVWLILAVLLSLSSLSAQTSTGELVEVPGGFQLLDPRISEEEFRATGRIQLDPTVPRIMKRQARRRFR